MLIRYFRSGFFSQHLLVVLITLVLWLPEFLLEVEVAEYSGFHPFFDLVFNPVANQPMLGDLLALVLFLFFAFSFSRVVSECGFQLRTGTHGILFFVLVMGPPAATGGFSPWLTSLPFVLAVMYHLLNFYSSKNLVVTVFYASFFSAMAGLFHIANLLLFPAIFASLIVSRVGLIKAWLVPFVGFLAPFFFLAVYYFLNDRLVSSWIEFLSHLRMINVMLPAGSIMEWLTVAVLAFFSITAFSWTMGPSGDFSIVMRKRNNILIILLFMLVLIQLIGRNLPISSGLAWLVPAVFIVNYFSYIRKIKVANFMLIVLLLLVLIQRYLPLFL
jgi:hypothetical protein